MTSSTLGKRWILAVVAAAAIAVWPAWLSTRTSAPVGNQADLDFTLKDMNGADVRLADFRGRPVILNFWATWCGPCKVEIPALVALAEQYQSHKLTVLGVSVDDTPEDLRQFAAEYKMNYPVLVGQGHDKFQETYDALMVVPVTWFIRADGTIYRKHQGPATREWFEEQVKGMLNATGDRP